MTVSQGGAGGAGDRGPLPVDQERAVVARLNLLAAHFYRDRMPGSWVPPYLQARGLSPAAQARWHAGYAPASWDALTRHLRALGYADELIERAGLARQSQRGSLIDVFRDRAVFPILSSTGTVAGFIGRARDERIAGAPKYLNTPRTCLYDKSTLLFGLYEARTALAAGARPVIVEGPFDAIAVTAAGQDTFAGVAPCGTALTARHIAALAQVADLRAAGAPGRIRPGRQPAGAPLSALITCSARSRTSWMPPSSRPARTRRRSSRAEGAHCPGPDHWPAHQAAGRRGHRQRDRALVPVDVLPGGPGACAACGGPAHRRHATQPRRPPSLAAGQPPGSGPCGRDRGRHRRAHRTHDRNRRCILAAKPTPFASKPSARRSLRINCFAALTG